MLRETTFLVGGGLTIGLGVALAAGLLWAGAGFEYFGAWFSAALAVGFGAFFISVSRGEARERRAELQRAEAAGGPVPPSR